ncbi:alpha/beta fold hydrolase [Cellulomonas terrae]|uniref:Epoxide hydrolase EphF n=1 Tax=Cellulomonas terrae TaxID=311234 RepID=A0A511JGF5_9CELL|nr:alpha/beta hydrolase [Cellulomonas terrae]GEL97081.1 epoxide hydrolase EphF [Cellulomonas terrae]
MDGFPALDGVTHRFVEVPGLRMHVAEAGSGPPVLLLHGFPQHWWEWRKVVPGLADGHRVLCPDLRGAGWTAAPAGGYTREQLLADVVALLDALDLDRVDLVTHDYGAILGFALCLEHPDCVGSHVTFGAGHPFVRFHPRMLGVLWRLWFQEVIATPGLGPWTLRSGRLPRHLLVSPTVPDAWTEQDLELFVAPLRDPARARAGSALYRNVILGEVARISRGAYRDAHLTTPTVVLYGADDPAGLPLELLGGHEDRADDLRQELVPGAGHFVADERPDAVVDHARALFASRG